MGNIIPISQLQVGQKCVVVNGGSSGTQSYNGHVMERTNQQIVNHTIGRHGTAWYSGGEPNFNVRVVE